MFYSLDLQLLAIYYESSYDYFLALPANIRIRGEVTYSDKDSSLFQYEVNYECKRFYNKAPQGIIFQNCSCIFKKILFQSKIAKSSKNGAPHISSTWHFINLTFHQLDISSTWHFINLTFHQLDISSTWPFINFG